MRVLERQLRTPGLDWQPSTRCDRWRQRILKTSLIALLAVLTLSGCNDFCFSSDLVDVESITWIEVKKVPSGGDSETAIANSRHAQLAEWLEANRCGWNKYDVTLPTPDVIISSADFSVYVQKNSVFLGQSGETMLVKTLTDSEAKDFYDLLFASDR